MIRKIFNSEKGIVEDVLSYFRHFNVLSFPTYQEAMEYDFESGSSNTYTWEDINQYFSQLDWIDTVNFGPSTPFEDFILNISHFESLLQLKNLKHLTLKEIKFQNDKTVGLNILSNLETLHLGYDFTEKDENLPDFVPFINENLQLLNLANCTFALNIHLQLKEEKEILYPEIFDFLFQKLNNTTQAEWKPYHFKWGVVNPEKTIYFVKDNFLSKDLEFYSLSVYVINDKNKYGTLKNIIKLLSEVHEKFDCFYTKKNSEALNFLFLPVTRKFQELHQNLIYFEELKLAQKNGIKKHRETGYFVGELLLDLGGEDLITEIEIERLKEQIEKDQKFETDSNKHIQAVHIKNFKLFNEIEIKDLSQINLIIGNNGSGKTSLLQAIALGLVPENTNEISKEYSKFINIALKNKPDILKFAEIKLKWSEKFEKRQHIYQDELSQDKELPHTYLSLAYGENLFTDAKYSVKNHIDALSNGAMSSHSIISLFNNYFTELSDPLEILDKLELAELQNYSENQRTELVEIGNLILCTLNQFLQTKSSDNFRIAKKGNHFRFIDKMGNDFNLYQISEGYRTNIVLVTDILVKIISARKKLIITSSDNKNLKDIFIKVRGTILIDEFDKHMHPVWQKSFIGVLKTQLPNIQFILTTHNPFSVQSAVGGNAIQLVVENGIILAKNNRIENKNILGIIREYFTKDIFDYDTQNLLKQFANLLDKIDEGNIELVYSNEFKIIVIQLYEKGDELQSIIAGQLLQLNATLKKLNQKEFEL